MPLVRIDLPAGRSAEYRATVGDTIYVAMTETLNVPNNDRFQIIAEHAPGDLVIDPTYLDISRSRDAIIIQITLNEGRTLEQKKLLYKTIAEGLERLDVRAEDVLVNLIEVKKENWSFGRGIAQYAS